MAKVIRDEYGNEIIPNGDGTWSLKRDPTLTVVANDKSTNYLDSNTGKMYDGKQLYEDGDKAETTQNRSEGDSFFSSLGTNVKNFLDEFSAEEQDRAKEAYKQAALYVQPAYNLASQTNADKNAELEQAADTMGVSPSILRNVDEETQEAAIQSVRPKADMNEVVKDNPLTTLYLSDDDNLARSHDDVATLKWIEDSGHEIHNALELAEASHKLNDIDYKAKANGQALDELDATTQDERKHLIAKINYLKEGMPKNLLSAFGIASFAGDLYQNAKAGGIAGALGGAAAGSALPGVGTAAGAIWGSQIGMALDAGQQAAGEKYRNEYLKGISKENAAKGANVSQALNTAIALPVLNKLGSSLKVIFKADKTGILATLLKNTAEQGILGAAAGAADVEATRVAEQKALFESMNDEEKETVKNSAISMAEIGALISVPGFGWAALGKIRGAVESSHTIKRGDVAKKSIENFVDKAAPVDSEVDAGTLNAKVSDLSDADREATLSTLGVTPEDLQAEAEHGGTVKVTSGQFATLPESAANALYPEMRVEGKPSAREVVDRQAHGESVEDNAEPVVYDNGPDLTKEEYIKSRDIEVGSYELDLKESVPKEKVFTARNDLQNDGMSGRFGESMTADKIIEDYKNDKLSPEAEEKLNEFARERGYATADDMVQDMEKHPSVDDEIKQRVDEYRKNLDEEYGYDEDSQKIRDTSGDEAINQIMEEAADMEDDVRENVEKAKEPTPEPAADNEPVKEPVADKEPAHHGMTDNPLYLVDKDKIPAPDKLPKVPEHKRNRAIAKAEKLSKKVDDIVKEDKSSGVYDAQTKANGRTRKRNRAIAKAEKLSKKAKEAGDEHTGLLFDLQLFGHKAAGEAEKGISALKSKKSKKPKTEAERLNERMEALKTVDATTESARKILGVVEPLFSKAGLRLAKEHEKKISALRVKLADTKKQIKFGQKMVEGLMKDNAKLEKSNAALKGKVKETKANVTKKLTDKYEAKLTEKNNQIYTLKMTQTWIKGELQSTVRELDSIISDLIKETKDSKLLQSARNFHMKKDDLKPAKLRIAFFMNNLRMSSSADYRRFRRDAERCHRIAERHYRRAMRSTTYGDKQGHGFINWRKQVDIDPTGHVLDTLEGRGNEAAAAFKIKYKEIQTALKWKRREAMAKLMEQHALKIFDHKKSLERQIIKMAHSKLSASGDMETKYQVSKLISAFGFDSKPTSSTSRFIAKMEKENPEHAKPFDKWLEGVNGDGADLVISDEFKACMGKSWNDLTPHEADEVFNTIKSIQRAGKNARTMYTEGNKKLIEDERMAQIDEMNKRPATHHLSKEANDMDKGKLESNQYIDDQKTMDTIIGKLCDESSRMFHFWIKEVHFLADKESNALNRFLNGYDIEKDGKKVHVPGYQDLWKVYSPMEKWRMGHKLYSSETLGCHMTKSQMLTLLMNMGSEENRTKLFGGIINNRKVEGTIPIEFIDEIKAAHLEKNWTYGNVLAFIGEHLDKRDVEVVQNTWNMLDSMWPKLKEKEFQRTGKLPKAKLKSPVEITLRDGTTMNLSGGYYPLSRHPLDFAKNQAMIENGGVQEMLRTDSFSHATTVQGFLKQVTSAEYSVSLDPTVLTRYITDAIHDYYFRDWVADAYRIWNDGAFQNALFARGGNSYRIEFHKYMDAVAGSDYRSLGAAAINSFATWLKRNMASASIAMNLGVIVQNLANSILYPGAIKNWGGMDCVRSLIKYGLFYYWPKSIFYEVMHLGSKFMPSSMADKFELNHTNLAASLSPMMRDLVNRPDATLRNFQDVTFGRGMTGNSPLTAAVKTVQNEVAQFSGYLMWYTDSLTSVPMWIGAHEKFLRINLAKGMSEIEAEKEASFAADMLIRRVNGSPRRQDISAFMRGKPNEVYGFFNTFMGFFNTEANRWFAEKQKAGKLLSIHDLKNKPRFLAFVASRVLVFQLASNLLMGKAPDEDNPLGSIISEAVQYPFSLFPVLKDVAPAVNAMFGLNTIGYRPPIQFSMFADAYAAAKSVASLAATPSSSTQRNKSGQHAMESVARFGSDVTGFPRVINNLFWNAVDYDNNTFQEWTFEDFFHRHKNKKKSKNKGVFGL